MDSEAPVWLLRTAAIIAVVTFVGSITITVWG